MLATYFVVIDNVAAYVVRCKSEETAKERALAQFHKDYEQHIRLVSTYQPIRDVEIIRCKDGLDDDGLTYVAYASSDN